MVSYIRGRLRTLSDAVIVGRYLAGEDSTAIGADANCSADTVLYLVRRSGHKPRPRGPRIRRKVLRISDDEITRLYKDGFSGPVIAERAGTTPATIYALLDKAGIQRRSSGDISRAMLAASRARRLPKEPQ
jgi:hypothetical protein